MIGERRLGETELPLIDAGVPPVREVIAVEALRAVLLRDDLWALAGLQKGTQAEGMVGMAVRVDRRVQRRVAPRSHRRMHAVGEVAEAGGMKTSGATSCGSPYNRGRALAGSLVSIGDCVVGITGPFEGTRPGARA